MGKTGTTTWAQIKGVRGQIRLVRARMGETKKPGPNQRFKSYATLKKVEKSESQQRGRFSRGGRGGRRRGGREGADARIRKGMARSKKSAMGVKKR